MMSKVLEGRAFSATVKTRSLSAISVKNGEINRNSGADVGE